MKPNEISSECPIAIAVAGTPSIQRLQPWLRAVAIATVMTNPPEGAINKPEWVFNELVRQSLEPQHN